VAALRVLIADDHPAARESLVRAVGGAEIEVVAVLEDGRSALSAARRLRPDVALLDLRMPELSGSEVARELRREGSSTLVIILSAFDEPSVVQSALAAGAVAFLSKEATAGEIVALVTRCAADA
jgi:two-component system, NarL family, nitrate/nitrite response regulator NarL